MLRSYAHGADAAIIFWVGSTRWSAPRGRRAAVRL